MGTTAISYRRKRKAYPPDTTSSSDGSASSVPVCVVTPSQVSSPVVPTTTAASPWRRNSVLFAADLGALTVSLGAANSVVMLYVGPAMPIALLTAGVLCLGIYMLAGLYPTLPRPPVEEIGALAVATTVGFAVFDVAALTFGEAAARPTALVLAFAWPMALVLLPLGRAAVRTLLAEQPWWGCPVVVIGAGPVGRRVVRALQLQPELGLRPVAILDNDASARAEAEAECGVPALGPVSLAPHYATRLGLPYALVAAPSGVTVSTVIERYARHFRRLIIVPDIEGVATLWVGVRDVGGAPGFEVQHRLLTPWRYLKRVVDFGIAFLLIFPLLPVLVVLAIIVKLDSPGPAFYFQDRLGRGGRCFRLIKFRTMFVGAHDRLREVLDRDPEAKAEYEKYAKLKNDPRVTQVGRLFRKLSLDELPQLLNVLSGDMSLVGPRAYIPEELARMRERSWTVTRVTPGITGLWQVSGRNNLSFDERLDLDARYIQNWSFSLDLYLLARTVPTVLFRRGAA